MKYYPHRLQIEALAPDIRQQFEGLCSHWMGHHVRTHDEHGQQIVCQDFWIGKQEARYADLRILDCMI